MLTLILPAYNEATHIAATLFHAVTVLQARGIDYEILVPIEGTDHTRGIISMRSKRNPRIRGLWKSWPHEPRQGKGAAIQRAVREATGDIIGYMDADGKTSLEHYATEVVPLLQAGYDLVIGSRVLRGACIAQPQAWYRRWGSRGFRWALHALIGLRDIPDTQAGYKFFRREAALDLFQDLRITGYLFDIELLLKARQKGYRLAQIPITWRDDGDSRLTLGWMVRTLGDLVRLWWASSTERGRRQ